MAAGPGVVVGVEVDRRSPALMRETPRMHTEQSAMPSIMLRLREHTRAAHDSAEKHPFQVALVRGLLPLDRYVAYLGQLSLVHGALDRALDELHQLDPRAAAILSPEQRQSAYLREDLAHFDIDPAEAAPTPGSRWLTREIERARRNHPIALLGAHYVLLGSTNGGVFIARAARKAYGLDAAGVRYFDPFGLRQRGVWQAFRDAMDASDFDPRETEAMLGLACATFEGVQRIADDVWGYGLI